MPRTLLMKAAQLISEDRAGIMIETRNKILGSSRERQLAMTRYQKGNEMYLDLTLSKLEKKLIGVEK